jgi:hypothetical protein
MMTIKEAMTEARFDAYAAASHDEPACWVPGRALWYLAQSLIRPLVCRLRGHDVTCDAEIGPDSGSEHIYCVRCGTGTNIIYY